MATYSRLKFSGSTDGKCVKVVATATAGTLIHTAHATAQDEIYLYAHNTDTTDHLITVEFGGVADPDDLIRETIPARSVPTLVIPGWSLSNSLVCRVFADAANLVTINGYVLRVT
jgi:hypothetical protein